MTMDRDAWVEAHRGKITASDFQTVISDRAAKGQATLLERICSERAGGELAFMWSGGSEATGWGNAFQQEACELFGIATGYPVQYEPGLILHPNLPDVGASPDGLVISGHGQPLAVMEIKCPHNPAVHAEHRAKGMPAKYLAQVQGQMWCLGVETGFFISFDPRAHDGRGDLFHQEVRRDAEYIERLECKMRAFLELLKDIPTREQGATV